MKRIAKHRPSPAMAVAMLALFVAIGGGATAAVSLKKNSVGTKQLKANAVTGIKANEATFGQVPTAANATNAVNATNAASSDGPFAFAHITGLGDVVEADSKGITDPMVSPGSNGEWCLHDLPFSFKGAVATVDFADSSDEYAQVGRLAGGCPVGTDAGVGMFSADGVDASVGVYVAFFR